MRKTLINQELPAYSHSAAAPNGNWLNLDTLATVQITSEDPLFPIEHALGNEPSTGWRAAAKGPQFIRVNFDKPTALRRIHLHFIDRAAERSQEFALYAASTGGELREVLRQQFTFSPGGSTEEIEDYTVDLSDIATLELRIDPDRAHDPTHSQYFATLQSLRLA
jgi:hypothetical protein